MRSAAALVALVLLAASGCGPAQRTGEPAAPVAVLGPDELVAAHNAWVDSRPLLWARATLMLNFPTGEADGRRLQHDLDGHVFVERPERLFVHGQMVGQEVFTAGMNPDRFWLWIRPGVNTVWTGRRGGRGERDFVLAPADLMTALGLFRIDLAPGAAAELVALPRQYVLTEQRPGPGRRPARRIWFDRVTLRPVRVDLFDEAGRRLLMAELLTYDRTADADVCTVYRARFYGDADEVDLVLRLTDVRLDKKPNPRVFEYRRPPGAKEQDLDAVPPAAPASPPAPDAEPAPDAPAARLR
ncbi:MAG: hypothetical protein IMZ66_06450 [Planctomycetes bacterium]|nr:hypothetical protein [Planctomycetota bacterium]